MVEIELKLLNLKTTRFTNWVDYEYEMKTFDDDDDWSSDPGKTKNPYSLAVLSVKNLSSFRLCN